MWASVMSPDCTRSLNLESKTIEGVDTYVQIVKRNHTFFVVQSPYLCGGHQVSLDSSAVIPNTTGFSVFLSPRGCKNPKPWVLKVLISSCSLWIQSVHIYVFWLLALPSSLPPSFPPPLFLSLSLFLPPSTPFYFSSKCYDKNKMLQVP